MSSNVRRPANSGGRHASATSSIPPQHPTTTAYRTSRAPGTSSEITTSPATASAGALTTTSTDNAIPSAASDFPGSAERAALTATKGSSLTSSAVPRAVGNHRSTNACVDIHRR